jgi:hypothetical protein
LYFCFNFSGIEFATLSDLFNLNDIRMLNIPVVINTRHVQIIIVIPAKIGFQISINENRSPRTAKSIKNFQSYIPKLFKSGKKLIEEMELNITNNPT